MDDIRYHVTDLHGIKENKLQRALDMRLNGALIHIHELKRRLEPENAAKDVFESEY